MNYDEFINQVKAVRETFPNMGLIQAKIYVKKMRQIEDQSNKENNTLSNFTVQGNPEWVRKPMMPVNVAPCAPEVPKETETKEADMRFYDDCDCDEGYDMMTENTKNYVTNRLYNIRDTKIHDLRKAFGLTDDDGPQTPAELVARIKDGKFTFAKGLDGTEIQYDPIRYIKWRDPAVKEDKAGFQKAHKALDVVYQDAVDTVTVVTDEQARLKALKDFEAVTVQ